LATNSRELAYNPQSNSLLFVHPVCPLKLH